MRLTSVHVFVERIDEHTVSRGSRSDEANAILAFIASITINTIKRHSQRMDVPCDASSVLESFDCGQPCATEASCVDDGGASASRSAASSPEVHASTAQSRHASGDIRAKRSSGCSASRGSS